MNRYSALASFIRRNKYAENTSLSVLAGHFLKGTSLQYTSNGGNYYIVGDSQVRFLIYKLIPLAVINHSTDLSLNSNYTNNEVIKHLTVPSLRRGVDVAYVSNTGILEDLVSKINDLKYAKYFTNVESGIYAADFPKLDSFIKSLLVGDQGIKQAGTVADLQKFFEEYLSGRQGGFEELKAQLLGLPRATISAFDDGSINKLSFIPLIQDIKDFITINHVESYYDVVVNLAVTGAITQSSAVESVYTSITAKIAANPDYEKYLPDIKNVFDKLKKAYATLETKKLIIPLAGKAADRDITNFFTMVFADQGREVIEEISSEDTGILKMEDGKISSIMDKLSQWRTRFMTSVREQAGDTLAKMGSGNYIKVFLESLGTKQKDVNIIVDTVLGNVLNDSGIKDNLVKSARKSNAVYAMLLKYAGKKEKTERLISNNSMFFDVFTKYIKGLVSLKVARNLTAQNKSETLDDKGSTVKLNYGYSGNISDLVFFNSFLKQIESAEIKSNLSSSYVWSGFDLTESESTYVKGVGVIEIPIGFAGYNAKAERSDVMGQGDILRIEFKDSFIRVSTQSFYVRLVGQYDDSVAKAILDGNVMDNRIRGNLQNMYTGAAVKAHMKELAPTHPEIAEILKNFGENKSAYCLSEEGDLYLDAMSGSNYYKKESISRRGLTVKQLEGVITKIKSRGYLVNSTKGNKQVPLEDTFIIQDLENALAALERSVQYFTTKEHQKIKKLVDSGKLEIGSEAYIEAMALAEDVENNLVMVMEFSVGDQSQFCTHFVYPLYGESVYTDPSGVERVKQKLVGFFKRKTPAPRQAIVYEVKGVTNAVDDELRVLRENVKLKNALDIEYRKIVKDAGISFDVEDGDTGEFPLGLDGAVSVEFPRVLERLGEYLDKYVDPNTTSKVALVFLGKELENKKDEESGQFAHRIMENDYFSSAYKKRYAADINKIFFILKRIYDNNKALFAMVRYKPVANSGDNPEEFTKGNKKIMEQFKEEYSKYGLVLSSTIIKAINTRLNEGQITFDEIYTSAENVMQFFTTKEGSGKDVATVVAEIEAKHNKAIGDIFKDIYLAVQEDVTEKLMTKDVGKDGKIESSEIVKNFMKLATTIRRDTKELVSIVNKYKYEKAMLYDLIRSGRVKLYLDTMQDIEKKKSKGE